MTLGRPQKFGRAKLSTVKLDHVWAPCRLGNGMCVVNYSHILPTFLIVAFARSQSRATGHFVTIKCSAKHQVH
jgi:hypothetical protein